MSHENKYIEKERKILDFAHSIAAKADVPLSSTVRIGHNAAKAILESAKDWHCNLVLLGWKGYSSSTQKILGEITDAVVTHARADIMLVKLVDGLHIKRVLLPTAGGEHARCAETYAATLVKKLGGQLTVCRVQSNDLRQKEKEVEGLLDKAKQRIKDINGLDVKGSIMYNDDIIDGIIEASENYDTIVIGATRDSIYQQILFGSIPEKIAQQSDKNIIMIKHYDPIRALLGRVVGE